MQHGGGEPRERSQRDAAAMRPVMASPRSLLPHVLAALYCAAIAYASLQPFGPWIAPAASAWWPMSPDIRTTRFDAWVNIVAYLPLGLFVGLVPRRAHPVRRVASGAFAGFVLSFALESAQAYLPMRDASLFDWLTNTAGAALGGALAASLARSPRVKRSLAGLRRRWFIDGALGDFGIALLALWLVAQANPGVGLFATSWDPSLQAGGSVAPRESATFVVDAVESTLQTLGMGIFVALIVRNRRHLGAAMLVLIVVASITKGIVSLAMLRPPPWQSWLRPEISTGIALGALLLLASINLPRAALVVICTVSLLLSILLPPLLTDQPSVHSALSLFNWRYGQLLNFNGLTHSVLLAWPLLAAAWLFALAGQPRWGEAGAGADAGSATRIG